MSGVRAVLRVRRLGWFAFGPLALGFVVVVVVVVVVGCRLGIAWSVSWSVGLLLLGGCLIDYSVCWLLVCVLLRVLAPAHSVVEGLLTRRFGEKLASRMYLHAFEIITNNLSYNAIRVASFWRTKVCLGGPLCVR